MASRILTRTNQMLLGSGNVISTNMSKNIMTTQINSTCTIGKNSEEIFKREDKYGAHNYHPLPVALSKASGKNI